MDKIALQQLVDSGVRRMRSTITESGEAGEEEANALVLDRLVQAGQIALAYDQAWLLDRVIAGLLELFKVALPADNDAMRPTQAHAQSLFDIGARVWILGADAIRLRRFESIPKIVLQRPVDRWEGTFWLRYTVTMVARGQIGALRGKSLIGPISEVIRERPQFFAPFESNLDVAVNSLCQFDFLACLVVAARMKKIDGVYPNFGGYYSERTTPIVEEVISGGPPRKVIGDMTDGELAHTLYEMDQLASRAFFGVNGWHGYSDRIRKFILDHGGGAHGSK